MLVSLLGINPSKYSDIFKTINELFKNIKQSTKKTLMNKVSMKLLGLEFKSNNILKSKAMELIAKKKLPAYQ